MSHVAGRTHSSALAGLRLTAGAFFVLAGATVPAHAQELPRPTRTPPSAVLQPMIEAENAFMAVAEHVTPAVVSIQTERVIRDRRVPARTRVGAGAGSGFIVAPEGYILTNNHVVAGATRVRVTLLDKREFTARVIGRDPTTDVAVIKIDGGDLPVVALGDDGAARVGQWVLAIGNPLGLDFTVTAGIVSAKGRSVAGAFQSQYAITDFIQTDAAINPGNSGGPLVNIRGQVIGINSAILTPTGVNAGYGFAIPITLARDVMDDLIRHGEVRRAVLGLQLRDVDQEAARRAGLRHIRGVEVGGFPEGESPARRAGVGVGDVIVAINGRDVDRVATLQRIVRSMGPGALAEVTLVRNGDQQVVRVRLGAAPAEDRVATAP